MAGKLAGKLVLITGGARGIGYALAAECAAEEARLALIDIDAGNLKRAVANLKATGVDVRGYRHNVGDRAACYRLAKRIKRDMGNVDILVNNAGIVRKGDFLGPHDDDWQATMDINVNGLIWMMKAFVPAMVERNSGQVVNVASILGLVPVGSAAVYSASKHAAIGLAESVAMELEAKGVDGVSFTLICPGFIDTGMFQGIKATPLLKPVKPEKMARQIKKAIIKKKVLRYPRVFHYLPLFRALTPTFLWNKLNHLAGTHTSMNEHSGEVRPPRSLK